MPDQRQESVHMHEPRSEFHEFHNGRHPRMIFARVKSMGRLSEREITENVENRTVGPGDHVAGLSWDSLQKSRSL